MVRQPPPPKVIKVVTVTAIPVTCYAHGYSVRMGRCSFNFSFRKYW